MGVFLLIWCWKGIEPGTQTRMGKHPSGVFSRGWREGAQGARPRVDAGAEHTRFPSPAQKEKDPFFGGLSLGLFRVKYGKPECVVTKSATFSADLRVFCEIRACRLFPFCSCYPHDLPIYNTWENPVSETCHCANLPLNHKKVNSVAGLGWCVSQRYNVVTERRNARRSSGG
ncbi:hypothetical protein J2S49_000811 [Arcanobacterium wilhelmae]|uniref:Uncharacterized protein n=1 Tax=Arcanobacterium wilhelmae TaxID=1803177 RepID=A0ABT9NAJ1_9ACTO|nr:hypothetical protein [Arcanobacterium wilhelmae]